MIHFTSSESWRPAPIDPAWIIEGAPITRVSPLSGHGSLSSGLWHCTAGRFHWHYSVNESIYILDGFVMIRDTRETTWHHLTAGDSVLFTKGSIAEWIIDRYVQKFYVIHTSLRQRAKAKLIRKVGSIKKGLS